MPREIYSSFNFYTHPIKCECGKACNHLAQIQCDDYEQKVYYKLGLLLQLEGVLCQCKGTWVPPFLRNLKIPKVAISTPFCYEDVQNTCTRLYKEYSIWIESERAEIKDLESNEDILRYYQILQSEADEYFENCIDSEIQSDIDEEYEYFFDAESDLVRKKGTRWCESYL